MPRYKFIMLHILEYRALKCIHESQTCNNLSYVLETRARSSRDCSTVFAGEDTIFTIIVDNVQYPLVDIYPGRARFLKN